MKWCVRDQVSCKLFAVVEEGFKLVDDYKSAYSFKSEQDAREFADFWSDKYPSVTIEIYDNWYISWADGVNCGFVDSYEDFVSDDLDVRALWFESEEEAQCYIAKLRQDGVTCDLQAVDYIWEDEEEEE